jgi:hypothetical protein
MRISSKAVAMAMACGLGLGLSAAGSAQAGPAVLNFSGACGDCTGLGTGTLTLQNFSSGPLTTNDFVSFVYKSNLVSFTLNSSDIVAMIGSIDPNDPSHAVIDLIQLGGTGWEFQRNDDGTWSVSSDITGKYNSGSGGGGGGGGGGSPGFSGGPGFSGSPGDGFGGADTTRVNDDVGTQSSVTFDAITVPAGVPEPASWAMMILGFTGMGALLRARRQRRFAGIETA